MAKVTEQDVITYLQEKVNSLQLELKKTQSALDAFIGTGDIEPFKGSDNSFDDNIKSRRGRKPNSSRAVKPLPATETFDPKAKLDGKIAYILSTNGPSFNTDIINKLQELEPEKNADKLSKAIMVKLSSLHKAGRIKGEKEGRKFKYEL